MGEMTAEIVQFIPRARNRPDSDFPTIIFKAPNVLLNAHERELYSDTAPSEMSPAQTHNQMILDRIKGVPANIGPVNPYEAGYPVNAYIAPDRDPA